MLGIYVAEAVVKTLKKNRTRKKGEDAEGGGGWPL